VLDLEATIADQREAHPDDVGDLLARAGVRVGTDVTLYLVDFGQVVLQPVPSFADPQVVPEENVASSLAGRAFTTGTTITAERPDGVRVWVPVREQSVRAGVLAITVATADEATLAMCRRLADLAGLLVSGAAVAG
jgi:hypothetical protein